MQFTRIFCHALSRKSVGANIEYGSVTKDRAEARHRRLYRLHAPRLSSSHEDDQRSQQQPTTDLPDPMPVGRAPPCRWLERSRVLRIRTCNGRSRLLPDFSLVKGCQGKACVLCARTSLAQYVDLWKPRKAGSSSQTLSRKARIEATEASEKSRPLIRGSSVRSIELPGKSRVEISNVQIFVLSSSPTVYSKIAKWQPHTSHGPVGTRAALAK